MWKIHFPSGKVARFALHTGLLFAVLIAIHVAVGSYPVFPLYAIACAGYLFLPFILNREFLQKPAPPDKRKSARLLIACMASGASAALALNASLPLLWVLGAYRWDEFADAPGAGSLSAAASFKVAGTVDLLLLSALLLGLALAYRPEVQKAEHDGFTTQFRGLSGASILSFWLWGFVFVAIIELLFVLSK